MIDALTIAENERRFIAQELHDQAAQTLLQINMQVSICQKYLEMGYHKEAETELLQLEQQTILASKQIRELITDLRPPTGKDDDLRSVLQEQIALHTERNGPLVRFKYPEEPAVPLDGVKKLAVTRIVQEALLNIRKHAQATQVTLTLTRQNSTILLRIEDNGKGFDDALIPNPLAEKGGAGMINMFIRASAADGNIDIHSTPNQGTTLTITLSL